MESKQVLFSVSFAALAVSSQPLSAPLNGLDFTAAAYESLSAICAERTLFSVAYRMTP